MASGKNLIFAAEGNLLEHPPVVLSAGGEGDARKLVAAAAVGEGDIIVSQDRWRKVSVVRVKCASPDNRDLALHSELRVCVGLLTVEGEASFDFLLDFDSDVHLDYGFGPEESPELLCHGKSLAGCGGRGSGSTLPTDPG